MKYDMIRTFSILKKNLYFFIIIIDLVDETSYNSSLYFKCISGEIF